MIDITPEEGLTRLLDSILGSQLAVLCGAGLSMAPPSRIPSAEEIGRRVQSKYHALYGSTRPAISARLDEQAEHFRTLGQFESMFLRSLIEPDVFESPSNSGHTALGDLLLIGALSAGVTANVDQLIEKAGSDLFGYVETGLCGSDVARVPPHRSPLLKIHGCWRIDRDHTIWTVGQLASEPIAKRIAESKEWLQVRLLNCDLLIVGFFTDWDYLNEVLSRVLDGAVPARVIVVDPASTDELAGKAPALFEIGARASVEFAHVRSSGADFLNRLRAAFSKTFVRRILHAGAPEYINLRGHPPDPGYIEPSHSDSDSLWRLRRDLEGCLPNRPATLKEPPEEPLLGLTMIQLSEAGARADGAHWNLNGQRIRVLRTPNRMLHTVQNTYSNDDPPVVAPDIVIAVGADSASLPSNIVRSNSSGTVARGGGMRWFTRTEAIQELGL